MCHSTSSYFLNELSASVRDPLCKECLSCLEVRSFGMNHLGNSVVGITEYTTPRLKVLFEGPLNLATLANLLIRI